MDESRTLCVMGTFDEQANREVKRIKGLLAARGILPDAYEPHITFGIYTELNDEDLLKWIGKVSAGQRSIRISFNHFGFFPDSKICFLAPGSSMKLLELHSKIHERYDSRCNDKGCLYSLKEEAWVSHMTLASIEPGQEEALLRTLREEFSPFTAEIVRLKVTSSDMAEELGEYELGEE